MSTWDDKPNDYEHALAEIEKHALVEIEKLEAAVAVERERCANEVEQLLADFNDCNAERARWKAELAAERERCAAEIKELRSALEGMLMEWDKLTRYGSPMAKAANERVNAALAAIRKGE